jgi:O-antigen/teichoic acid export membrane protein
VGDQPDHPAAENDDETGRRETELERLDRNWGDLLQELRVVQTGVQLLTGFLLTLPFQQKFSQLDSRERGVYLFAVAASIVATGFLQAPVSVHRALFRKHRRKETVQLAHRLAIIGIFTLGTAVVAVPMLIFEVLLGWAWGITAGVVTATLLLTLWLIVPWTVRARTPDPTNDPQR